MAQNLVTVGAPRTSIRATGMERWKGHVAVVTGASKGIGASIAEQLVLAGMKVVAFGRNSAELEKFASRNNARKPGSYIPYAFDLTNEADILAAFANIKKEFKTVHVLVNCAGVLFSEKITEGSTEYYRKILDVNVLAVAICTREATKLMREHEVDGHIININSVAGHNAARILIPVSLYCASKYAVTGMCESLRNEFESLQCGIKVSSISPGPVRTEMLRSVGCVAEALKNAKILDPEDVTNAVMYVLSTPPHVQVNELMITPIDHLIQNIKG